MQNMCHILSLNGEGISIYGFVAFMLNMGDEWDVKGSQTRASCHSVGFGS